jgi:hypothetical protein
MFRLTSKVKIAAGLAAGALTLGAAGAYAAANANNTITVSPTPITLGSGSNQLKVIGFNGTTSLTMPEFKSAGECVSFLAKNKNIAIAPQGSSTGPVTLSKNYHGKLMSGANAWCKTQLKATAKTDTTDKAETETPEAPEADSADSTASQGHGHAFGHGKHAGETR